MQGSSCCNIFWFRPRVRYFLHGQKGFPGFARGGDLLFPRRKSRQKCAGGWARSDIEREGRALVPSACTPGPPRRATGASVKVHRPLSGVRDRRLGNTPDGLCPPAQRLSVIRRTQLGAWQGIGPEGPSSPGLVPADEVLSLTPEKVPKERVQGEGPLDTPRSVGVRRQLSGGDLRRCGQFLWRPMASYRYAFDSLANPFGCLAGWWKELGCSNGRAQPGSLQTVPGFAPGTGFEAGRRIRFLILCPARRPMGYSSPPIWWHQGIARRGNCLCVDHARREENSAPRLTPPCPSQGFLGGGKPGELAYFAGSTRLDSP